MRHLICLLIIAIASSAPAQQPENAITWVFLNTGASRNKIKSMSQEEVQKMQAQHVGNFGTLFDQGRLFAAGPLGDNGFIRGIVILNAATSEQVTDCFKSDPFVQNDILEAEAHPWLADVMRFGSPKIPFQMAQHTLCIVKKGKNWEMPQDWKPGLTSDAMLLLFPALKAKSFSGELAIWGPFSDATDKLGLLMFYSTNVSEIQTQLDKEPAVADGRVEIELHPQFLGAGTFRTPHASDAPPEAGKQMPLFDGTSFQGWQGDTQRTWRIEKSALVGGSHQETVPHNEFLCATQQFKNFDLRLKAKLTGAGFVNGGVQFRSQRTKDPAYEMTGYQADMGEGYWGSLYDESRRNKVLAHTHPPVIKHILKTNDWNDYVIRCEERHIRLWLDGVLTVDYTEQDKAIPLQGLIGLQIHGGGKAEASYRDITIEELP